MFSRLFGKKENKEEKDAAMVGGGDWSFIGTDMHSHFVPAVDDGAQTIEDSIALVRAMMDMGFKSIITTPHIKFDHFPNTRETILTGLQALHAALKEQGIDLPVKAAAEYYIDDHFMQLLNSEPLLTIQGKEVLVELSFMFEPMNIYNVFFEIQTKGYRPILAHPERYLFFHGKKDVYHQLRDKGVMLQLNTIALTGYYGKGVKETAEYLLENKLYDYCGSDMHHLRHAEQLKKVLDHKVMNTLRHYPFRNAQIQFI
ncbi:MAG: capsular biosynthesis protein [Taibaiella sp.]|nr:capsular biosynthesis protein [Taibaiella sp.]